MDDLERDLELIGNILRGEITDEEKKTFEQRLMSDSTFKKTYEEQQALQQAFTRKERARLFEKLENQEKVDLSEDHKIKPFYLRYEYWAAASIALIALVSVYWWQTQNHTNEVFLSYYKPYENLNFQKSRGGSENEEALQAAAEFYNTGNFKASIDTLVRLEEKDDRHYYVLGLASIELKEYTQAISYFENISDDFEQTDDVNWYKALAFVALNRNEEALKTLSTISAGSYPVDELVEALNK